MTDRWPEAAPPAGIPGKKLAPRVARFWWIGALRGVIAMVLGTSVLLASGSPERLATFFALYWFAGGVVTLRFALAMRPSKGFRLASVAGVVAIVAAVLLLLRELLSSVVSPEDVIHVFGVAAVAMGALRLVGAFEVERRTGHRWTLGGLVLGGLELGTGILLLVAETQSRAAMITIGIYALASGTLLILQAVRARRIARELLADRGRHARGP